MEYMENMRGATVGHGILKKSKLRLFELGASVMQGKRGKWNTSV